MAHRIIPLAQALGQPAPASSSPKAVGYAEGFAAANARISAVMNSDAGKRNPAAASFLLSYSDASAEKILAALPCMAEPGVNGAKVWADWLASNEAKQAPCAAEKVDVTDDVWSDFLAKRKA